MKSDNSDEATGIQIIKKAVERMMTSNALSKKQLSNLRIFKDFLNIS